MTKEHAESKLPLLFQQNNTKQSLDVDARRENDKNRILIIRIPVILYMSLQVSLSAMMQPIIKFRKPQRNAQHCGSDSCLNFEMYMFFLNIRYRYSVVNIVTRCCNGVTNKQLDKSYKSYKAITDTGTFHVKFYKSKFKNLWKIKKVKTLKSNFLKIFKLSHIGTSTGTKQISYVDP
jgi:hypothetical protein